MNPKVSIITVVYNDVKNIEKSILNTLSQTYQPLELIVVDGASTDGTLDLIKQFNGYIKWISEPDKGIYDAMNKGCEIATGEWLLFHNCGDFFLSRNSVKNFFEEYKVDNGEEFLLGMTRNLKKKIYKDETPAILSKHYLEGMPFCHPATFCRRLWQLKHPFNIKYRNSADYEFCIRSILEGASYYYIEQPLVLFDCREGATATHYDRTLRENIEILTEYGASEKRIKKLQGALKHMERNKILVKSLPFISFFIELYRNYFSYKTAGWKAANTQAIIDEVIRQTAEFAINKR